MKIPVRYNHVGYAPDSAKIFFVNPKELEPDCGNVNNYFFRVIRQLQYTKYAAVWEGSFVEGTFGHSGVCEYTGEILWSGNFTDVNETGLFFIQILRKGGAEKETLLFETESFEISNDWICRQLLANIKSFYYQRSGVELPADFAGKWARPAAHLDDNIGFHPSMHREGTWNAHGGWYDAGDYGKYIVNGGVSVATLLLACELIGDCECESLKNKAINAKEPFIAPDGLKMYSLKEEIRFELDFFLRMQDTDGGVFFKVTPEHWDGFVSPTDSDLLQKRMILGKSTTSTLNFAGTLAAASRVYSMRDPAFAERCLQSAVKAYKWAVSRPFVDWPHNTEGSGGYGDEHAEDEFFWARAMLYRELQVRGEVDGVSAESLRPLLLEDMKVIPPKSGLDWRDTQNLGWLALALQGFDREFRLYARTTLNMTAREIVDMQNGDAYGIPVRKFIWGSNGDVANHALTLAIVKRWAPSLGGDSLDFWCREMLNYIYGRNPVDVSFVTGSAWSSPKDPHHRLSHSDGVEEPIPGLLVGGINSDRQDMHRAPHYPGNLSGYSYTDERCSFASNETAINWNAPLTAVLALLCF
ncbi:endoglucanase [Fibrobacter sp. UWB15]|uniref:glycoside hydrolase family 9 protein n=1 Tax=unclassified Fibrobacter TaxID=2634177 RepID=UPI00092202F7|nr:MULTISPECIES: glycoside hydrolase family 9 protein [unclassified Fibrobacter]PWJ67588.1 endoglucanase [Fibrobacter sp. UWB6]SHF71971.1 endoglucanase [Fibrobacter sp. UWB8]SMG12715.1 endoglucanase [Fibrobacter sp. UWB15]